MIGLRQHTKLWGAAAALLLGGIAADAAVIPGTSLTPTVWLKADAVNGLNAQGNPNALPANNAQLPFWGDSSGNSGRNATQSNVAQQPRFITNTVNGKPVVRFDGSSTAGQGDFMNIPGPLANTDLAKLTLFIVSNDNRAAGDINNKDILSTRDNRGN